MFDKKEIKQIGIFRALQLGDILCSIPAMRNLRANFPAATISFIGLPGSKTLIDRFPNYFDEFIAFPGYPGLPEQPFDETAFEEFSEMMCERKLDLLLQMQGNGTIVNEMLAKFKPKCFAGFSLDEDEMTSNPFLMRYPNFGHETSRHLKLMSFLGLEVLREEMEYPLFGQDVERFAEKNFPLKRNYICVHAGSRAAWRQWPTKSFAKMADLCCSKSYQIVLTGTQAEANLADEVAAEMKYKPLNLAGQTDLGTLGALLNNSSGLIANCTGISHIAAGLKVPSVIISMDGEPERWAPLDQALHHTIDWTKHPDENLVQEAVLQQLLRQPTRSAVQ